MRLMPTVSLAPHPAMPCPGMAGIDVHVLVQPDGGLSLTYTLAGSIAGLRIPAPADPCRADGLWRHTCFEAFIMAEHKSDYREFNFSPSGQWAAYAFRTYRDGAPMELAQAPAILCQTRESVLHLETSLPRSALPDGKRIRLGLTAVLEQSDGALCYWALRHPPGKPDFHHTDGFALTLELP
jgi:hypothetical protein